VITISSDPEEEKIPVKLQPRRNLTSQVDLEADMPVPDRLLPKQKSQLLTNSLRMSQRIGLLLCLARKGNLSKGGQDRLFYLQSKAPFEAI